MTTEFKREKSKKEKNNMPKFIMQNNTGFNIGDKVYVLCGPERVSEAEITAWEAVVINDKPRCEHNVILKKARVNKYLFMDYFDLEDMTYSIPFWYIFKTQEEADKKAKFISVKLQNKIWDNAVGNREDKSIDIDDCELGPCCSNISDARDILLKCKKNKGLTVYEIDNIIYLLKTSGHDELHGCPKNLKRIYEKLNIPFEWKDDEHGEKTIFLR